MPLRTAACYCMLYGYDMLYTITLRVQCTVPVAERAVVYFCVPSSAVAYCFMPRHTRWYGTRAFSISMRQVERLETVAQATDKSLFEKSAQVLAAYCATLSIHALAHTLAETHAGECAGAAAQRPGLGCCGTRCAD